MGVQTQLTEEQARVMREYAAGFVDQPRGLGTVTDRNAANVVALADAYLAQPEILVAHRRFADMVVRWAKGAKDEGKRLAPADILFAYESTVAAVSVGSPETREPDAT